MALRIYHEEPDVGSGEVEEVKGFGERRVFSLDGELEPR
jgi:hypothetical protein